MTKSYYNPIYGTCHIQIGAKDKPFVSPMKSWIVVACDLGRKVYSIRNGAIIWEMDFPESWPRALCFFEGIVYIANGNEIIGVNPESGYCHFKWTLSNPINSIEIRADQGRFFMSICYDTKGYESVELFEIINGSPFSVFKNNHKAYHPRGAYYLNSWLFISDTFGHEVYAVDIRYGTKAASVQVYFPNSIEPISNDEVRICAEHENRITNWNYVSGDYNIEFGCNLYPFNINEVIYQQIKELEMHTEADDKYNPHKTIASVEHSGDLTLYSPNSARMTNSSLLICDTDNHRVLIYEHGIIKEYCDLFNNPVNAVMIKGA